MRAALFCIREPISHRLVVTNHHIVLDGWSLPVLLHERSSVYYGRRLPAPVPPYRRFVTWLTDRDRDSGSGGRGREVLAGFDSPTLVPSDRLTCSGRGDRRSVLSVRCPQQYDLGRWGELARTCHTTVSTVLQGGFRAGADVADRSAVISRSARWFPGRPAEVGGRGGDGGAC